jgi:hypothetical protein
MDPVVQLIDVALDNNAIGGAVINLFSGAGAIGDPRRRRRRSLRFCSLILF